MKCVQAAVLILCALFLIETARSAEIDMRDSSPALTIFGARENDFLGQLAVGDFNADGFDDLALGAAGVDDNRPGSGIVYLIFGRGEISSERDLLEGADLVITPVKSDDRMGASLAAGDVNGDRIEDLIIGAPMADVGGLEDAGQVYVIFGRSGLGGTLAISAAADVTISGLTRGEQLGISVAVGDFNGDRIGDIAVGIWHADGPAEFVPDNGHVRIFTGSPNLPKAIDTRFAPFTLVGSAPFDNLGWKVAAGDLNGDGIDDLAVGALNADRSSASTDADAGAAYLVFGSRPLTGFRDVSKRQGPGPDVTLIGPAGGRLFGSSLAVGDFNNDGVGDLAVGAPTSRAGEISTLPGAAHLFFGPFRSLELRDAAGIMGRGPDVSILGGDPGDAFAIALASGDFNSDGSDDLAAGAWLANGPGESRADCGEDYILFGRRGLSGTFHVNGVSGAKPDLIIFGRDAHDTLGNSIAAGDFNADGAVDLAISAFEARGPNNSRGVWVGEVYILLVSGSPVISLSASSFEFGSVQVGDSLALGFTISNKGTGALRIDQISIDNPAFTIDLGGTVLPASLAAGRRLAVKVNFAPQAASDHAATLRISSNSQTGTSTTLALRGQSFLPVASSLVVLPRQIDLQVSSTSSSSPSPLFEKLLVQNNSSDPIGLLSFSIQGLDHFRGVLPIKPFVLQPGATRIFGVRTIARAPGVYFGSVIIRTSDPQRPVITVPLSAIVSER